MGILGTIFSSKLDEKIWNEEAFPALVELGKKYEAISKGLGKQIVGDIIDWIKTYYDPLIVLGGVGGGAIDASNIDNTVLFGMLDRAKAELDKLLE